MLAVLPKSNNTLNVSRAFVAESLAHEPATAMPKESLWLRTTFGLNLRKTGIRSPPS
jgi:hypothetical protein